MLHWRIFFQLRRKRPRPLAREIPPRDFSPACGGHVSDDSNGKTLPGSNSKRFYVASLLAFMAVLVFVRFGLDAPGVYLNEGALSTAALMRILLALELLSVLLWQQRRGDRSVLSLLTATVMPVQIVALYCLLFLHTGAFSVLIAVLALSILWYAWRYLRRVAHAQWDYAHFMRGFRYMVFFALLPVVPAFFLFSHLLVLPIKATQPAQLLTRTEGSYLTTAKDKIHCLDSDTWQRLDERQRLDVLQVVANIEASYLGFAPVQLGLRTMDKQDLSYFQWTNNAIWINRQLLQQADPQNCLESLLHECYHAYQKSVVESGGIDWKSAFVQNSLYFRQALQWRENFEHYQTAADGSQKKFEAYY